MLAYGLAVLTDLSGWFFYLFSILISLNFLKKNSFKTALSAGFVAGLGMLFKESTAAAPIFFASLVFIATQLKVKEKLKYIFVFGAAFLLPVLINSFFIYKIYSYSYLHWYRDVWHHQEGGIYAYSSLRILIEIGRVFALGWVFVLLGVLKEFSIKNKERLKILIAFLFASLSFFLWSFPHNRIIFIAAPILTFLGSFGLLRKTNNPKINTVIELILLSFYVLVNYFLLEFLLRYGIFLQNKF